MAARRPAKPKLAIVTEKEATPAEMTLEERVEASGYDLPDDLDEPRVALALGMLDELKERHEVVSVSDIELVANACRAAKRAAENRALADAASLDSDQPISVYFRAQSAASKCEGDFKRFCSDLGLSGRDRTNKASKGLAAQKVGTNTASIWGDRLTKKLKPK